ncbi:hypothetical protein J6590_076025 [Homalodisca vitripennis]|nr:hypothetical protein J6590_076025 [Homalodisca vitripennis]
MECCGHVRKRMGTRARRALHGTMAIKIGLIFGVPCHQPPCHPASVWTSPAPRAESGVSFEHVTGLIKLSVCGAKSAMPSTACQYKKLHGVQCTFSVWAA